VLAGSPLAPSRDATATLFGAKAKLRARSNSNAYSECTGSIEPLCGLRRPSQISVHAMPNSKPRKSIRSVAKAARHKKVLYLPLDRDSVAQVAVQVRMALEVARVGQGNAATLRCLAQAVALTGLIAAAGYGELADETLCATEAALCSVLASGNLSGWGLDARELSTTTDVINEHDRQLRETRLDVVVRAFAKIERRLSAGLTLAELFLLRREAN
jgi:hypothetical protein